MQLIIMVLFVLTQTNLKLPVAAERPATLNKVYQHYPSLEYNMILYIPSTGSRKRPAGSSGTLSTADHQTIQNKLSTVKNKWRQIGSQLYVPYEQLEAIEYENHRKADLCLEKMIHFWLTNGENRTWSAIADALEKVDNKVLAKEIRE